MEKQFLYQIAAILLHGIEHGSGVGADEILYLAIGGVLAAAVFVIARRGGKDDEHDEGSGP